MKIKVELFGASREFSKNNLIEFEIKDNATIKDIRNEMINYLEINFDGNKNFKKIVESSAFCSENNNIVSDNYKITKDEKIAIIPPIGGG
ncbi:MoaD/ThiS family protein [Candidatus Pelagibacter sp.]|nr:MoaD/ThiS family protein [Candidatus Pelagibacter sp.]